MQSHVHACTIYPSRLYILQINIQFLKYLLQNKKFSELMAACMKATYGVSESSLERYKITFFRLYCQ